MCVGGEVMGSILDMWIGEVSKTLRQKCWKGAWMFGREFWKVVGVGHQCIKDN